MTLSRTQINYLGDRLRADGLTDDNREQLLEYRASFLPAYGRAVSLISGALPDVRITGRPEKTPDAIVAKLRRTKIELARMQDITGCRLKVLDIREQDGALERLLSVFPDARVVDHRRNPRFGYRAIHVIPVIEGHQVEIQLRTFWQDLWANLSESFADRVGIGLKYGEPSPGNVLYERTARMLVRASQMVATIEDSRIAQELFDNQMFDDPAKQVSAMGGAFLTIMTLAMEETA